MSLLSLALISIIIYLVCDLLNVNLKTNIIFSLVPPITYILFHVEQLVQQNIIIILFMYLGIVLYVVVKECKLSESFGFSLVVLPWTIIIYAKPNTIVDIVIYITGTLFILLFIGDNKNLKGKKIFDNEADNIISILVLTFFMGVILLSVNGTLSIVTDIKESSMNLIVSGLVFILAIHMVGGLGSFVKAEKIIYSLGDNSRIVFNFFKLVAVPTFVFINLKSIINIETLLLDSYILSGIILFLSIRYFFEFKRTGFILKSHSIAIHNSLTMSLIFIISDKMNINLYIMILAFSFLLSEFLHCYSFKSEKLFKYFFKLLYLGVPLSPLFIYKIYFYREIITSMGLGLVLVFSVFVFMPLILFSFFERFKEASDTL